ncbi:hypothetical protein LMG18102_01171 [Ralstonia mannitolilytica]|uniref:DUF4011 domain-containing protein n=1 Tax=Ralstonia mannitolilytica TaxID=105219 RepID=UPI0028F66813|nr:DUF4011 domain-containing protein [Ralstonia mannitolilytica]CAJ0689808.1 hypothetical protein LMG18102_01171 [Ralstonia mannitolilytica]
MTTVNLDSSALTSALEQLRLKLLDLTGRNRLINFKHTAGKSLQFIEGHPAAIYQRLVEANNKASISILGLPEPSRGDWVERNGRLQRPEPREWAKFQGISTSYDIPGVGESSDESNVRSLMYPDDLAKHCRKIEREATLAIEETGANMLFLVLGFLEFPDQRDSDKTFTAPLISVPVSLQKKEIAGSNYDFAKKKDAYFKGKGKASPFVLTQEVRAENEWTPTLLAERQKRLVGVLKDHWNLAVSTGTAAS